MRKKGRITNWEQLKRACKKFKNVEVLNCAILVDNTGFDVTGNQIFKGNNNNYWFNPIFTEMTKQMCGGEINYQMMYECIEMFNRKVDLDKKKIKEAQEQK